MDNKVRICLISNINFDPFLNKSLNDIFSTRHIKVDYCSLRMEEYFYKVNLKFIKDMDYILVIINFNYLLPNYMIDLYSKDFDSELVRNYVVDYSTTLVQYLKKNSKCEVLFFTFENYYTCNFDYVFGNIIYDNNLLEKINQDIMEKCSCCFIDFRKIIASIGINNSYDFKKKYRWNIFYSQEIIDSISKEVFKQHLISRSLTPKCLILDCDGVLWDGVLAESGSSGVILTEKWRDFQRYITQLFYHGVIIAIVSKNDIKDVMEVFNTREEMILKEDYISIFKANWNNKADNIMEISKELNISLNEIVFIDDNDFEINFVHKILPSIHCILFKFDNIYKDLTIFNLKNSVDRITVEQRTQTYQSNQKRKSLKAKYLNESDYVKALKMKIHIHKITTSEYNRASELSLRTNKCTNGKRYSVFDLNAKLSNKHYTMYTIHICDVFSNLGLVGIIGLEENFLDVFALSCRAFGRGVEDVMLKFVKEQNVINYYFKNTGKNTELESKIRDCLYVKKNT